jgi:GST-like protein
MAASSCSTARDPVHLAEKSGKFAARPDANQRAAAFVADVRRHRRRPVLRAGGALPAFRRGEVPYAHNRYQYEAARHYGVLDAHPANHRAKVAEIDTIVDMDVRGAIAAPSSSARAPGSGSRTKRLHDETPRGPPQRSRRAEGPA